MALEEHLDNSRRAAEVAIDLKGWMSVEQVRQRRLPEQRQEVLVRPLTVAQPREEVDDPGPAPPGVTAAVGQPPIDRGACRGEERRVGRSDGGAWMEAEQVRYVAMTGLGFLVVLDPFHDCAVATDAEGRQPVERLAQRVT